MTFYGRNALTVREVASLLGVSRQRIYQMIGAKQLRADRAPAGGPMGYVLLVSKRDVSAMQTKRAKAKEAIP